MKSHWPTRSASDVVPPSNGRASVAFQRKCSLASCVAYVAHFSWRLLNPLVHGFIPLIADTNNCAGRALRVREEIVQALPCLLLDHASPLQGR